MACSGCGNDVPEGLSECPFCGATQDPAFDGNVLPPRRRQRNWWTDLQQRWTEGNLDLQRRSGVAAQASSWLQQLRHHSFIPWEVPFSLLVPGLGHLFWGMPMLGLVLFAGALLFLGLTVAMGPSVSVGMVRVQLIILSLYLGGVHAHAFGIGQRRRLVPFGRPGLVNLVMLVVIVVQMNYVLNVVFERGSEQRQLFRMYGYNVMRPTFQSGDMVAVEAITSRPLQYGDIVVISRMQPERVLGLGGDLLEIRQGKVWRNGQVLGASASALFAYGRPEAPDHMLRVQPVQKQRLSVPDNEIGYLNWGRALKTRLIASCGGIITEIVAPPERACLFVNGLPVPVASAP